MSFASSMAPPSHRPLQTLKEDKPSDCLSALSRRGSIPLDIKPLSLPSLASITANLPSNISSTEQSQFGPHRSCPMGISSGRRFSPLGNSIDSGDSMSPLDSEHPSSIFGEGHPSISGISMIVASTHRPRSRSFLSGPSLAGNFTESDAHADESASDSGSSDKKHEDNDSLALSKKRSRTLTTPSQQRRLMQVLEQTRFPSTEVREQLARELGMPPRRVQIWFQNRRQSIKKALEHKTENDNSGAVTPTSNPHRSRGFSFGAYPTPTEMFNQTGLEPPSQANFIPSALPPHDTNAAFLSKMPEPVDDQEELYDLRSVSRGVPRNLHLQLSSDHSAAANHDMNGGSVSDFIWSDPLTGSSLYSDPSLADKEANFSPFGKANPHCRDSNSQTFFSVPPSRHRSQTNPDLFGIMNGFMGLPGSGQMASEAINPFQQISHSNNQRDLFSGCNLSAGKNDLWPNSHSLPVSNWHESLEPLELETSSYASDQPLNHMHNNLDNVAEMSAGFYYTSRNQETMMEDNLGFSTLPVNTGGDQDSLDSAEGAAARLQHHLRQRSQSLNSFV